MNTRVTIDAYLDALFAELRLDPARTRRVLAESEDHLREAVAAEVAAGATPEAAEAIAIGRFGSPGEVGRRFRQAGLQSTPLSLPRALIRSAWLLAGIGLLAIGLSGGLAAGFGRVFGKAFVAGDAPGVTYTASRCADFLGFHPESGDCSAAATAHHFDEVVGYRLDAGVLGAVLLASYAFLAWRRRHSAAAASPLPRLLMPGAAAALFGTAAVGLLVLGVLPAISGQREGGGSWLSAGFVSMVVAAGFAVTFARTLRGSVWSGDHAAPGRAGR